MKKQQFFAWILCLALLFTTCGSGYVPAYAGETDTDTAITVYFTLSEDGTFVTGNDAGETVLAHIPVTIDYFDLADYGMEEYYRYEADSFENGGEYIGTEVIEKPTLLHLFIKMLEEYYLGDGSELVVNDKEQDALSISGSPTSLYMTRFWGHDENLMYYVNHKYPLQAAGWGSTSDYILLEDGMEIDVAMFSDWDFYHTGAFAYFTGESENQSAPGTFTVAAGEDLTLIMRATSTNAAYDGNSSFIGVPMGNEKVVYCRKNQAVSDNTNKNWTLAASRTDNNGNIILSFPTPGIYYVSSTPLYENYQLSSGNACVAPPIAVIHVTGEIEEENTEHTDYAGELVSNVHISKGISTGAECYETDTDFTLEQTTYTVEIPDYEDTVCLRVELTEKAPERTKLTVKYTDLSGQAKEVALAGNDSLGKKLMGILAKGIGTNDFTLEAVCENEAVEDVRESYQFHIQRTLSLESLTMQRDSNGTTIALTPEFDREVAEYAAVVTTDVTAVRLNVQAFQKAEYEIQVNGNHIEENGEICLLLDGEEEEINITLNYPGSRTKTYTIDIGKTPLVSVNMLLTEGSVLQVKNSDGVHILRYYSASEQYEIQHLAEGAEYTYTITKYGCNALSGSFVAQSDLQVDGRLSQVQENTEIRKEITAQWGNFRGNTANNGVTNTLTPTDYDNAQLYWAKKAGSGYGSGAPSSPILVDDCLVYTTATTIVKVDTMTGEVVAKGDMVKTSAFNITPPTYADGMIFVALASGTIQAFNAATLESLWVYEDPLFGQPDSPITYCDGYIYSGFWIGETGKANFVCLSVTDENVKETMERKEATWTYSLKGGFYWAGSCVKDGYVIVGTDDGEPSDVTGNGKLLVFDALTGHVVDSYEEITGDVRSSICYDAKTDKYYFTSKGGGFYAVEIAEDGRIEQVESLDLGGGSTSTPVVVGVRAYVGVKGVEQFGVNSGHHIAVIDLATMTEAYILKTRGYPQTSGLATTGYEGENGYTYVYFIDNYEPGKVRVLKDKPGQTEPVITRESEYGDENDSNILFSPKGIHANYAICSLIADQYGTMYFKNDSAYMMALGSKITKIEVTKQPDKQNYQVGEIFDVTGMEVMATYANGNIRDITKYVTCDKRPLTAAMSDVEVSFDYLLYNDELLTYEKFDPLLDTVNITVTDAQGILQAERVVEKISAIGTVTLDSGNKIKEARKAYDSLDSALEGYVENRNSLFAAEAQYQQLLKKYFDVHPNKVTVKVASYQSVTFQWQKTAYAEGYIVYRRESGGETWQELGRIKGISYTDKAVVTGKKYDYKILPYVCMGAWEQESISGRSNVLSITPSLKAPTGMKASLQKKKYSKLRWKKVSGASGYVIYRAPKKKGIYKKIKIIKSGRTITYTDKKVKKKKKYYYKIRAYRTVSGKKVYGAYSSVRSVKIR